jgi:transposase-like protein
MQGVSPPGTSPVPWRPSWRASTAPKGSLPSPRRLWRRPKLSGRGKSKIIPWENARAFSQGPKWYPIIYVDGTFLKVRREGIVGEEVVYLVLGISEEGMKEVLTFFPASFRESAEVWKEVLADLKERGLKEPLLFIGDRLTGLPHAVKEINSKADFQSCLLHKMRQSLAKVRKRDR